MRLVDRVRSAVYDAAIVGMTADWYRAVLQRLPNGCRLLDVGGGLNPPPSCTAAPSLRG